MPEEARIPPRNAEEVPVGVRAQLLATEHWSLPASRSTTQNEVLTRISMFLTLTSAGLVSLALVGQATDFGGAFPAFAIAVLGIKLGAAPALALTIGAVSGLAYFAVSLWSGARQYFRLWKTYAPQFPSPAGG